MAERTNHTEKSNGLNDFFAVIARPGTYKNIVYLLLSFPLGILYFTAIIIGLSLGVGLLIIYVGFFVLIATALMIHGFSALERLLATGLVGVEIPRGPKRERPEGFLNYLKVIFTDPLLWKGMVHHLLRFPLGIVAFVLLVTMFSLSIGFIGAPVAAALTDQPVFIINDPLYLTDAPLVLAALVSLGLGLLFVTLHMSNGLALGYAHLARLMLGGGAAAETPAEPVRDPIDQPASDPEKAPAEPAPQV